MEADTIAQLNELLSVSRMLQIAVVLLLTWLILRVIHFALQQTIQHFPRYRLQMGQIFPVIRLVTWFLCIVYIIFVILKPPQAIVFAVLGSLGLAVGLAAQ